MSGVGEVSSEVLASESIEELQRIDKERFSFYPTNKGVEKEWENESEERISSYEKGSLPTLDEADVFSKYKR